MIHTSNLLSPAGTYMTCLIRMWYDVFIRDIHEFKYLFNRLCAIRAKLLYILDICVYTCLVEYDEYVEYVENVEYVEYVEMLNMLKMLKMLNILNMLKMLNMLNM